MTEQELRADNERLRALIKSIEWKGPSYPYWSCIFCQNEWTHKPDCPGFTKDGDVK